MLVSIRQINQYVFVQVVCNCLSTLNEILASEGGIVVNRNITHYLLNRSVLFVC